MPTEGGAAAHWGSLADLLQRRLQQVSQARLQRSQQWRTRLGPAALAFPLTQSAGALRLLPPPANKAATKATHLSPPARLFQLGRLAHRTGAPGDLRILYVAAHAALWAAPEGDLGPHTRDALHIVGCAHIRNATLRRCIETCAPNLVSIDFSHSTQVNNSVVSRVLMHPHLQTLVL